MSSKHSTVDSEEVKHFQNLCKEWWDEVEGPMRGLHTFNRLRIPFIKDGLVNAGTMDDQMANSTQPFAGLRILDLGCGGGILAEPLARLGGEVTGLDPASDLIKIAREHASQQDVNVNYVCSTIEDHAKENQERYDVIVTSEVLEHITEKEEFLEAACQCLKARGSLFVTTISKTYLAIIIGIWIGEDVLHSVPKGTHQYDKFITPKTLSKMLKVQNLNVESVRGVFFNPFANKWSWFFDRSMFYALHATKKC